MKPLFLLLMAFALCLGACHSSGHPDKKDSTSSIVNSASHPSDPANLSEPSGDGNDSVNLAKLKAKFEDAPNPFKGLWVSEPYVNGIRRRKPVHELQDSEMRCIVTPARTLQATMWIYGFHEGSGGVVFVKNGSDYFTYSLYNGRCADTLQSLGDDRLRIGRQLYSYR